MALSLNPSIHFSLCLTHMAGFLHVHTSSVTTKVTTREGLARPQARQRGERRGGGDGGGGVVGVVTETPPF